MMLKTTHRLLHQGRMLMQVHIGVVQAGVSKIRAERGQPALGISPRAITAVQYLDGHAVTKIVQSWPVAVRWSPQSEFPRQSQKRVVQHTVAYPLGKRGDEERSDDAAAQKLVPLLQVVCQRGSSRGMKGYKSRFSKLRIANGQNTLIQVHVLQIQVQGFADTHPCDTQQTEQREPTPAREVRGASPALQAGDKQATNLVLGVDVRTKVASLPRQEVGHGDHGLGIDCDVVAGKAAYRSQSPGVIVRVLRSGTLRPSDGQLHGNVCATTPFHKGDESHQQPLIRLELEAEIAAHRQVLAHTGTQDLHGKPAGHGRATSRSALRSTLAYRRVASRLRCRSIWPISVRFSPLRSICVAKAVSY